MFHEHLEEFDEWEEVDLEYANGEVVYAPVLDPHSRFCRHWSWSSTTYGEQLGKRPANVAERHRRANSPLSGGCDVLRRVGAHND